MAGTLTDLNIELLQQQLKFEQNRAIYFHSLLISLPCDITVVFENAEGRVKLVDINQAKSVEADKILKQFAESMHMLHKTAADKLALEISQLNGSKD